jgi:hypothetical protein
VVGVAEQRTAVAAAESDEPNRSSQAEDTDKGRYREHEGRHRAASGPQALSVWTTAQATGPVQRRGRYVPESVKHPARMLPAIAAHAVQAYTSPGDLVLDPMCGIGTSLVEAIHAGRDAIGVEYESRWSDVADANVAHAQRQGATGRGAVIRGDATRILSLVPAALAGQVALVVTSLAAVRDGHLVARPSFFQLQQVRRARAAGTPMHLIAHEDVLVFVKNQTSTSSRELKGSQREPERSSGTVSHVDTRVRGDAEGLAS